MRSIRKVVGIGLAILSVLFLSGCMLDEFGTDRDVFADETAVVPAGLADFYFGHTRDGTAIYAEISAVGDAEYVVQFYDVEGVGGQATYKGSELYLSRFHPLDGDAYIMDAAFLDDARPASDSRLYAIVRISDNSFSIVDAKRAGDDRLRELAAARGLSKPDTGSRMGGTLTPAALREFFGDVMAEVGSSATRLDMQAVPEIPEQVRERAYFLIAAAMADVPNDDFVGHPRYAGRVAAFFRRAADRGISTGHYMMARLLALGLGVPADPVAARREAEMAAASGHPWAKSQLAYFALTGTAGAKDPAAALKLFREAANDPANMLAVDEEKAADPRALFALYWMYQTGTGVAKDPAVALDWLNRAAEFGLPAARFELGRNYLTGTGVAQSDEMAAQWLSKAADKGHAGAQALLAWMGEQGLREDMSEEAINALYLDAARDGYAPAQWRIGEMLASGKGSAPDRQAGLEWIRRATAPAEPISP